MSNTIGSSTVDERIVEMRIDNEKFEAGAKKTISILESLDRNLKGISEENVDGFDNIGKSLDKVTDRFSAFGIVGDQIMRNLTNRAMEMVSQVKNMTTMLTTQQIGAGWDKYADKTSAIQTIMAATSNKIEEGFFADQAEQMAWVNEQIEKLNRFTDETSYNFLDMVNNIGKFTAAGRELEESVTAMEGIANWAAISGGRPAEAARAMYNLSQALGMGAVTTIDWKSIENANMATYEFKQQAIDTAVQLGRLKKVADGVWETVEGGFEVTVENFRNSLSFGRGTDAIKWFDSDVLLTVLNRYGAFSDLLMAAADNADKTVTEYLKLLKAYKAGEKEFQDQIDAMSLTEAQVLALLPDLEKLSAAEYDLGFRAFQAAQEAKTFTEAIDATRDAVSTKWMTVFELLFGNYLEAKELWTTMAEDFWTIFAQPVDHLIAIIKNAGGFIGKDGFTGSMEQAAGGTAALDRQLQAAGKTMDDFYKALEEHVGSARFKALEFAWGSIEEALLGGAVSAEEFRGALGKLDDSYNTAKTVSLDRALLHAGKTMDDFEKSIMQVGGPAALEMVKNFGSVEEALRQGGIWADLFNQALNNIGVDSENVTQSIEETVQHSVASLEEMRQFALEVLRGDHGNGEERLAWYESMGLDAELMQAMAGNLHNIGQDISDEYLAELMEIYWQAQGLSERLGYATFAEYIASRQEAMEGYVDSMEELASRSEGLYASLFGEGILDEAGEYYSAGELFRKSLTNLLDALANFGETFDKAFMKVFGGSTDADKQLQNMSDGFFTLTAAFYSFSERVKSFSESETLMNFLTVFFSVLRLIGKTLGFVFKIGKTGLGVVLKLLSPVFTLVSGIFNALAAGIDALSDSMEDSGFLSLISAIGDELQKKLAEPIEKINTVVTALVDAFRSGFSEGGIMGGLEKMGEAVDILFQNHPIFLTVVHALGQALVFLKDALTGAALALGGILGGAISLLGAGFQKLSEWFGELIDKAKESKLVMGIWNSVTETFEKLGRVIQRVFGYAEQGYQEGGFLGALSALGESLERGIRRLVPGGEALMDFFDTIAGFFDDSGEGGSSIIRTKKAINEFQQPIDKLRESFAKLKDATPIGTRGIEKVGEAVDKIAPKLTKAAKVVETVTDGMFGDEEQKETFKDRVASFIQTVWDGILQGLRKITIKDVIGAMRLSLIASITSKLISAITIFTDIKNSIKSIPETLSKVGEKFANMMQGLSATFTANAVLKFAAAALLLSFVLAKLAKIPKEDLTHAAGTLLVILSVLAVLAKGLGQLKMGTASILGKIPNMTGVLIGLSSFILSLGSVMTVLMIVAHFTPETLKPVADTIGIMLGIVSALLIILMVFAKSIDVERLKAASKLLWAVGGAMALIGIAVRKLAFSILMLSLTIKVAGPENFNKAAKIVGLMLGAFTVMAALLIGVADNFSDKELLAVGQMFLRIAAAMVVVAFAMQMLVVPIIALAVVAQFMPGSIDMAAGAIALIFLMMSLMGLAFAAFLNKAGYSNMEMIGKTLLKIAATMVIAAVAMAIMVVPIKKMAELCATVNAWDIFTGILMMLGTVAAIGMLLTHWSKNTGANGGSGLIKVAASIALVAAAMLLMAPAVVILANAVEQFAKKLSDMDAKIWEKFATGLWRLVKLSGAIMVFGLALISLGLGGFLAGAALVSIAGGIFLLIGAVALLMLTLPGFIDSLIKLKDTALTDLWKSLGKVAIAAIVFMAIFGGLLFMLSRFFKFLSADNLEKTGNGLTKFFKGLASGAASSTSGGFAKVIKALQDPEKRKAITGAIATIVTLAALYISDLIPTFTHVIIGGITQLISSIATELSENGGPLVDAITELVSAMLGIVKDLIARLFGKESWDEMSWWQKGLTDIGGGVLLLSKLTGLVSFGKAESSATGLADKILGLGEKIESTKKGFEEVKVALDLANTASGGLLATLSMVAVAAVAIGAMFAYASECINEQQDTLRENAGDPKTLEEYAESISQVEARIAELDEALKTAGPEGMAMVDQELQAQKLLLKTFQNEYDALLQETQSIPIEETRNYAEELTALGEAWKNANGKEAIDIWQSYTRLLNEGAEAMGITTDELDAMAGGYRHAKEEAIAAAAAVETVPEKASETVNEATNEITASNEAVDKFKDNLKQLPDELSTWFGGLDLFSVLQETLGKQNIDISDVIKSDGSGIDKEKIASLVNIDKFKSDLSDMMGDAGFNALEGLGLGMDEYMPFLKDGAIKDAAGGMIDEFLKLLGIESPSRVMADQVGAYIPPGIGAGIEEHQYEATTPVIGMLQEMLHLISSSERFFETSGRNIVVGLTNGISTNLQIAYDAGTNLANTVQNGFTNALKIHSPSRIFMELARFIPLGIAEGVKNEAPSAVSSVTILGTALIDAVMSSMAMVSAAADDEFELTPHIRPVVDMDDINAASGMLGSAFGSDYSMSARMTGAISQRMSDLDRLAAAMGAGQTVNNGDNITFNIYPTEGQNQNDIADAVIMRLSNRMARRGAALG